jgi:hypothetical protein
VNGGSRKRVEEVRRGLADVRADVEDAADVSAVYGLDVREQIGAKGNPLHESVRRERGGLLLHVVAAAGDELQRSALQAPLPAFRGHAEYHLTWRST